MKLFKTSFKKKRRLVAERIKEREFQENFILLCAVGISFLFNGLIKELDKE